MVKRIADTAENPAISERIVYRKVRCPKCGYVWMIKSTMMMVTCPSCSRNFPI